MLIFTRYKPHFPWQGTRLEKMENRYAVCSRNLCGVISDYATSRMVRPSNPNNSKRYYSSSEILDKLWGSPSALFNEQKSLQLRHFPCVKSKQMKVGKVKTQLQCGGVFIMQTTCFGPGTGPSSGLTCVGGEYTVCFTTKAGSLQLQWDIVVLR
jgi:hypothetical protein